jgi:serine/threonine-protein kinase RsbT
MPILSEADIIRLRQAVRQTAREMKFGLVDQTRIITAASELARNTLEHGGGGSASLDRLQDGTRGGLRITFSDKGPGIPDIDLALTDGFSTRDGLGLGLGGSRRLVNDFKVTSQPGQGTTVCVTRWT